MSDGHDGHDRHAGNGGNGGQHGHDGQSGEAGMVAVRIAAFADVHAGRDSVGRIAPHLSEVGDQADLLLIGGDLTRCGTAEEAEVLARELSGIEVPVVAVLGNHDYHSDESELVEDALLSCGVHVLDGSSLTLGIPGADGEVLVGIAGVKGFGGGFVGASGSEFGEQEMKAFMRHSRQAAERLAGALAEIEEADVRVALLHYSPIPETLQGEPLEIYPFLGSAHLGEAVDRAGVDLVLHGHAHRGTEKGSTPAGIPVRNVALPVINAAYRVYRLEVARRRAAPARPQVNLRWPRSAAVQNPGSGPPSGPPAA